MAQTIAYNQIRDIALDINGDWLIGPSPSGIDIQMIGDAPALQQAITIALKSFAGEWFLNLADGVPYWQDVFIKNPNPALIQSIFRAQILGVDGVTAVTSLTASLNYATRAVSIAWAATGSTPVVPLTGELVVQL
jgi:hypothetical protein